MGLLASGAAHELGTPLSTLSVLIGDWQAAARLKDDPELHDDLADMDAAVQRCKTIVSGILMSAGEERGEAPQLTTLRDSFNEIVAHPRAARRPGTNELTHPSAVDSATATDPALRQVIGNQPEHKDEGAPA